MTKISIVQVFLRGPLKADCVFPYETKHLKAITANDSKDSIIKYAT